MIHYVFIAPNLPFQGDQAVEAKPRGRRPPPYLGGVWSIVLCVSRGDDRALLGLGGDEAEETGHSEREGGEGGEEEKRSEGMSGGGCGG